MASCHVLDVSELHGEAARLHAWVVTTSGPQQPSVVQPLKCAPQHLPLWSSWYTMTGAQKEPLRPPPEPLRRSQPPLDSISPTFRDTGSDGTPMDRGQHTPPHSSWGPGHPTQLLVGPQIQILSLQLTSCLFQPNPPRGKFRTRPTKFTPPWSRFCSLRTNSHHGCSKLNSHLNLNFIFPASLSQFWVHIISLILGLYAPPCSYCWP